jgi:uncharacterized protein YwqG
MKIILLIAIVVLVLVRRPLGAWLRERRRRNAEEAAKAAEWRRQFDADNPEGPPLTDAEVADFRAWLQSLALPAAELWPAPERPVEAGGSRLGGPVWLPEGEAWPVDGEGTPLEFMLQVDFADLPPLEDFPHAGILQFFVGADDLFGLDYQNAARGDMRVLWHPDGLAGAHPHPQPSEPGRSTPFERDEVRRDGLPLEGRLAEHQPSSMDWRIDERLNGWYRRDGYEKIEQVLDEARAPVVHHVGGHPEFTQFDIRGPGSGDDYDRTLLRLTSDGNLMWGDAGEAVFLIRRADLLARDFSSVLYSWDCS